MEYPEYIQLTSYPIHKQFSNIIYNAIQQLKSAYWREGTKPQNNQLKVVMDSTVQLENLYENLIIPHIKAMRCLRVPCVVTREMVNGIQTLRKKDLITLLKKYDPSLGRNVEAPKTARRGTTYSDLRFGIYNRDWMWASIGSNIGKVSVDTPPSIPGMHVHSDNKVLELGHEYFELRANQNMFDALIKKYQPVTTKAPISKPSLKAKQPSTPLGSYGIPTGDPFGNDVIPTSKSKSHADIISEWAEKQKQKSQGEVEPLPLEAKMPSSNSAFSMKYTYTPAYNSNKPASKIVTTSDLVNALKSKGDTIPNFEEDTEL